MGPLLHRLRPVGQHVGQRDRDQTLGRTTRFPLPHHRDVELSHASRAGRDRSSASRCRVAAVPGRHRAPACRAMVVEQRNGSIDAYRVCEVYFRASPHGNQPSGRSERRDLSAFTPRPSRENPAMPFVQVGPLLIARSIIFNILFYLNVVAQLTAALPALLMPRAVIMAVGKFWARSNLWLLRVICNTTVEFRGLDKIPPGPLIVASKHQSLWETFALVPLFSDPAYIMKRELMWLPIFGWHTWKARMIAVDRGKGSQALAGMNAAAARELACNRQVIIFPEGTRRAPGAEPRYK